MISASLFYKDMKDAIEQVVVTGSALGSERTFRNSDKAEVYGLELEGRFGLGRITGMLSNFFLNGNYTRVKSSVTVKGTETTIARNGRPLQGQSPYTINIGLSYNSDDNGATVSLLYNRIGERIIEVATAYQEDIIEEPRDVIDFVINKSLTENLSLKISAKDILGKDQIFKQGDKRARLNGRESAISISISYKL
jgi:outer membrane receptor protein involved in Fe transport